MKVSELIGKQVLGTEGRQGYVISVNAEGAKIEYLLCADEGEREFIVDIENITQAGEIIAFEEKKSVKSHAAPLRLGRACFDERGIYLGVLEDYSFFGDRIKNARIGKKNYPAEGIIAGDIVIVKNFRRLGSDVIKDGKTLYKKGTYVTAEVLTEAALSGEYVQTTLKSL